MVTFLYDSFIHYFTPVYPDAIHARVRAPRERHERHLPHWQPEGAALFLTWRLHGSLPKTVEILEHRSPGKAFVAMDRKLDGAASGP